MEEKEIEKIKEMASQLPHMLDNAQLPIALSFGVLLLLTREELRKNIDQETLYRVKFAFSDFFKTIDSEIAEAKNNFKEIFGEK